MTNQLQNKYFLMSFSLRLKDHIKHKPHKSHRIKQVSWFQFIPQMTNLLKTFSLTSDLFTKTNLSRIWSTSKRGMELSTTIARDGKWKASCDNLQQFITHHETLSQYNKVHKPGIAWNMCCLNPSEQQIKNPIHNMRLCAFPSPIRDNQLLSLSAGHANSSPCYLHTVEWDSKTCSYCVDSSTVITIYEYSSKSADLATWLVIMDCSEQFALTEPQWVTAGWLNILKGFNTVHKRVTVSRKAYLAGERASCVYKYMHHNNNTQSTCRMDKWLWKVINHFSSKMALLDENTIAIGNYN